MIGKRNKVKNIVTILNGGYQTSSGTVSTITLTGANGGIANNGAITSSVSGAGTNGAYYVTGSSVYTNPSSSFSNGNGTPVMTIPHGEDKIVIEPKAELEVQGRVKINGEYLDERLERIETLLNIPTRDVTMEHKYPRLKELWEEYNRELAKYKTWDKLKDSV